MKTLILVNPKAREGQVGEQLPRLVHELKLALKESEVQVEQTTPIDHGSGIVRKALKAGVRKIVVVGGDGTISEAVQGFFEDGKAIAPEAVLVVMPGGRGDDFFKCLRGKGFYGSKEAWKRGLELIRTGKPEPTDVARIELLSVGREGRDERESRLFVNIASFGFPGLVVKRVLENAGIWGRSRLGKSAWTYISQSAVALAQYRPQRVEVKVDDRVVFDGKVFSGFVLNGAYNAGGVCWSRDTMIDDGMLDLVLFEPRGILKSVLSAPRMVSGDWRGVKGVQRYSGKRIEVRAQAPAQRKHPLFEIDGDQPEKPGTWGAVAEVLPGAIRVWR